MEKDMKMLTVAVIAIALIGAGAFVVISSDDSDDDGRDTLWQQSSLEALLQADYDGTLPVSELKKHGDFGLGTFDKLDGEMIVLDGKVYQVHGDGSVQIADDDTMVPFAAVTYFDCDIKGGIASVGSNADLVAYLNGLCGNMNAFYAAKISGTFDVKVRSELAQEKPYRDLQDVLSTDEKRYDYSGIEGTIVAIYCPHYVGNVNQADWHFHFISSDGTKGGHLLEIFSGSDLKVEADRCTDWVIDFPDSGYYHH